MNAIPKVVKFESLAEAQNPQETTRSKMVESGYFEMPNTVIDDLASILSDPTFKIYCVMIRKTFGWGKDSDKLSISQIMNISGKARTTVIKSCSELESLGLITVVGHAERGVKIYQVNRLTSTANELVQKVNQFTKCTSSSTANGRVLVQQIDTQKTSPQKKIKDTINQGNAPVRTGKFCMAMDWQPSHAGLQALRMMRVDLDDQEAREVLANFLLYWSDKDAERTQAEWEKTLCSAFTSGARQQRKQAFAAKPVTGTDVDACWAAYSHAYAQRNGAKPIRNTKTDSQIAKLIELVGFDDAPSIAAHFLTINNSFYVTRYHDLSVLLADCQKIRTEWLTGRQMTATEARQADATQNRMSVYDEVKRAIDAGEI